MPDHAKILALIAASEDVEKLRTWIANARKEKQQDIEEAAFRRLIEILPAESVLAILRYLVDDYWGRYLGWPDLLLHRADEFLLVEVKSSSDKLSAEQMRWIVDNHDALKLPFRMAKLHRPSRQTTRRSSRNHATDD